MNLALTVLLTGIIVVFVVLLLLIFIIKAYGSIISGIQKSRDEKEKMKKKWDEHNKQLPELMNYKLGVNSKDYIDEEVVAVISAAIAHLYLKSGESYEIKSIKRVFPSRSSWGRAGLLQNTKPF